MGMGTMSNQKLLDKSISEKALKGYIVAKLETFDEKFESLDKKVDEIGAKVECVDKKIVKLDEKINNVEEKIPSCKSCGLEALQTVVYGNEVEGKKGILESLSNLAVAFKIKSSFWGVMGGGGLAAILALLWVLLKAHP